jgi:hypothetical protein
MTDPPRYPDRGDDTGAESDREPTMAMSLWTKVVIIVFGLLIMLVLILHLATGGGPQH